MLKKSVTDAPFYSAHCQLNSGMNLTISAQPFVDLIAIRRFDKPVIGRDFGEGAAPIVYVHRQPIADMNHLGRQIGLRLPTVLDGEAGADGFEQLGCLLAEAGQWLGQHHEIELLMLPRAPTPVRVVVEQVDLAEVMQKAADKGHAGADWASLMLHT